MGEIVFIFGAFFGLACGRMFKGIERARLEYYETECQKLREQVRYWRKRSEYYQGLKLEDRYGPR